MDAAKGQVVITIHVGGSSDGGGGSVLRVVRVDVPPAPAVLSTIRG